MKQKALEKVNPNLAVLALENVGGDKAAAYSAYIKEMYRRTGSLACGCDNSDLQTYYRQAGL